MLAQNVDSLGLGVALGPDMLEMADRISALIFKALASEAESPSRVLKKVEERAKTNGTRAKAQRILKDLWHG